MTQGAVKPQRSSSDSPKWEGTSIDLGDISGGPVRQGPTKRYIAGTTLDSTFARVDVRHVSFHRHTGGDPNFADEAGRKKTINDARELGAKRWGCPVSLTQVQRDAVLRDIYDPSLVKKGDSPEAGVVKWIRFDSVNDNGQAIWRIVSIYSPSWKATTDGKAPTGYLPLGWFLYLYELTGEAEDHQHAEACDYPTIITRPEGFVFDPRNSPKE